MPNLAQYLTPAVIPLVLTVLAVLLFIAYYLHAMTPRRGSLEWIAMRARSRMTFALPRHPMVKKDALPLLLVTGVYALTAFYQLGSSSNPRSFRDFSDGTALEYALPEEVVISKLVYYTGLGTGAYNVEVSTDGEHWATLWTRRDDDGQTLSYYWADAQGYTPDYALTQKYNEILKWVVIETEAPVSVRYLRVTGRADGFPLELGELALWDWEGGLVVPDTVAAAGPGRETGADGFALFDEQYTVPDKPTWYNSTYFDEIYHARTAYEHLRGVYPYEVSHPPLGKLILSIGISLFGMTPFGWRFMGTLFGVLMLPILYVFLKNLFGKTPVAFCGTALFAFDFMHLTQTRIATIDTYGVFFILCMYFFMYRYLTLPAGTPFKKGAPLLFLSGLSWGLGAASKWTVLYAGAGLAVLYFVGLWFKFREWPAEEAGSPAVRPAPWLGKTLSFSVLCFVLLPLAIYCLSYLPYAAARGNLTPGGLFSEVWENQRFMLTYHQGVHDAHPYSSRWYQWIVDGRPILYYLDYKSVPGSKAAFASFNNPVVSWLGLLSLAVVCARMVRRRCGKALFLVVGYFAQLLPWMIIGRTTFAYHYFPSSLFLALLIAYLMNDLAERRRGSWRLAVYGITAWSAGLYALFYPVLIGLMVPTWYPTNLLRWLPSWPL